MISFFGAHQILVCAVLRIYLCSRYYIGLRLSTDEICFTG